MTIATGPNMRTQAVDCRPPAISRRAFLQAIGLASACRLHPIAARFTAIADDLVWLMRWCSRGSAPSFASPA